MKYKALLTHNAMNKTLYFLITLFIFSCTQQKSSSINLEEQLINADFIKIQLKKEATGHLIIAAKVNGVDSNLILDTGANNTVIDEKLTVQYKLESESSDQEATGAGKTGILIQLSKNNSLQISDLTIEDQELILMNLDYVNKALVDYGGEKIEGILGSDVLIEKEAIIDYDNLILYLKK